MFVMTDDVVLNLEHSLVSLSKWESAWEKPFLTRESKTTEEVLGYVQAMSLGDEIPLEVLHRLTGENFHAINQYIETKMTATWFREIPQPRSGVPDIITAEVIYHWIVSLQLDWECQYWHLNRLITLVKTINEKNKAASDTKKKSPTTSDLADRRALMERRRAEAAGRS
jgi:hypothetical protein